jgi:hypothetical protein
MKANLPNSTLHDQDTERVAGTPLRGASAPVLLRGAATDCGRCAAGAGAPGAAPGAASSSRTKGLRSPRQQSTRGFLRSQRAEGKKPIEAVSCSLPCWLPD